MPEGSVKIAAVGDIMLGDRPLMVGCGVRSCIESLDGYDPFSAVQQFLNQHDFVFGNLESVISDHGHKPRDYRSAQMRGPGSAIQHLERSGFNLLSVANNHIMQHGEGAFDETVDLVRGHGIEPVGCLDDSGASLPVFKEAKGIKFCFVGFSLRPEKYGHQPKYAGDDFDRVVQSVKDNRQGCDHLVVSLHWGDEYVRRPSSAQVRQARLLVDEGAALILGHHPHVVQGVEKYRGAVIAYSLGNFVFDVHQKRLRQTCILVVDFDRHCGISFARVPVCLDPKFKPQIIPDHDGSWNRKFLGLDVMIDDDGGCLSRYSYNFSVRSNELCMKIENRILFLRSILKYEPWIIRQSLFHFVESRLK